MFRMTRMFISKTRSAWVFLLGMGMLCVSCRGQKMAHDLPQGKTAVWGATEKSWVSRDAQTFGYTTWPVQENPIPPRAVIIAVHGLSGAARDFRPLGTYAAAHGVITYAYELRGQGNDPIRTRRGDIHHPWLWLADLADFTRLVRQRHPNLPLFYYGESMGALVALHAAALSAPDRIDGLILASPVVQVKNPLSWWQTLLLRVSIRLAPKYRVSFAREHTPPPRLTRDDAYQQWLQQAPHTLKRFTLRLLGHIGRLMLQSGDAAGQLTLPVLVLYAGQDVLVTPEAVEQFYRRIASRDKEKYLFPKSYHLLLHDHDKAQVLDVIGTWLQQRVGTGSETGSRDCAILHQQRNPAGGVAFAADATSHDASQSHAGAVVHPRRMRGNP
jgi:alpha-beta hydrolase superfamily lysophospholipase